MSKVFRFNTDDYDDVVISPKYKLGDKAVGFSEVENYTLIFAFDYCSLNSTEFCFNNTNITIEDYRKLYELKKEISNISISNFIDSSNTKREYHFHDIDLFKKKFLIEPLKHLFKLKNKFFQLSDLPTIYQIALYTEESKAPRIIGFFGKLGVFHVLWLDLEHKIFPSQGKLNV